MIVTVTPNPSLDRTIEIDRLERGAVIRARAVRVDPGGKGVNVSRALAQHGRPTVAVLPSGGAEGAQLAALLAPQLVPTVSVPVAGATRSNVTLVEPDGTTTKINEPGAALTPPEVSALEQRVVELAARASWVVGCGSLPRGVDADFYAQLVERAHGAGARTAVDTSGAALAAVVASAPDLLKPNHEELAELVGRDLLTVGDAARAAADLVAGGVGAVLVSLGAAGALLVDADGTLHARGPAVTVRSTVGAGDSTLAGFLAAGGAGALALRAAVAFGTAAVTLPGSALPGPDDLRTDLVHLDQSPDLSRPLTGDAA
ncbi:MAG TPA: 1-phosphofructokinase [Jiangellales bacterium]|nr:1-phosphofructokinase [Jiangellales bacterium]